MNTQILKLERDELLSQIQRARFIIVDIKILDLYKDISEICEGKTTFVVSNPEASKDIETFNTACEFFLSHGLTRSDTILAIGGGALSDLAGFVASSVLRGVSWEIIPTTLLSMIDASIGGKTAINTKHGKNLIGSFHLPQTIYLNSMFLKTLEKNEYHSGLGELIKYMLLDKSIYELLDSDLDLIIEKCANYKSKIVEEDFKESGKRKLLNLGHTLGHAIEKKYSLPHGVSVLLGMIEIHRLYSKDKIVHVLKDIANKFNIDMTFSVKRSELIEFVKFDKKISGDKISIIIADDIGEVNIIDENLDSFLGKLND